MIQKLNPYPAFGDSSLLGIGKASAVGGVLPHPTSGWYQLERVKTDYEISCTRYFCEPQPLRTMEENRADSLALEKETVGLFSEISRRDN